MVNTVQNSRNARFMPGEYGTPAQEPLGQVVFWNFAALADAGRRSTV